MNKIKNDHIYDSAITFENIEETWNIVRKTCKNRKAVYKFAVNKNTNIFNIYMALKNKIYKSLPFRLFLIFEPKARLVMSQTVGDKIVNHFVSKYYLLPYLERKLIDSNVATRKDKGSAYANKLIEKYINQIRLKHNNQEIFCLKIDISKYFYSINHHILIEKLEKDIQDKDVITLIKKIIDETNKPYVNELIDKFNKKYNTIIPYYENGVGLSIGAMTSQFFAIYYLNNLDHYIKEQLHCKYYVRYMDDFIIFDLDKERLKFVWKEIEDQLKKIKLTINPKSNIFRLSIGITFLGYKYRIYNHKLKITYRKKTIKKIKKRLEKYKALDKLKYYRIYGSYYGYLKKVKICERNFTMKAIEKYEYYKEKKPNYLVFIKEGSFYKTFGDDAVIIWHLFKYKWNNHAIAFGASTCSKVLDSLNRLGLSYCMVSDTDLDVTNDESVYDLYKELAIKNYSKFKKKEELAKMLEELLDSNINLYDSLLNYFKELKGANRDEAKNED